MRKNDLWPTFDADLTYRKPGSKRILRIKIAPNQAKNTIVGESGSISTRTTWKRAKPSYPG